MAAGILAVPGIMPSRDRNGRAVVARIRVYIDETTTPLPVYTTSALLVAHSQPIASDDAGRFPLLWRDNADPVTLAWETDDGQTNTVYGLYPSTGANTALTDDANAALEAMEALVAGYSAAVRYAFSTSTADSDPGAGVLQLSHADVSDANYIYIDAEDANGIDAADWLDGFDDANDSADRGIITIRNLGDPAQFAVFSVAGDVFDSTGYRRIPVTFRTGGSSFDDAANLAVSFAPAGPIGVTGDFGWTPVLAVVSDGARRVEQVVDWTGGSGTKPATGLYVGATGFEALIANGVDIRGAIGISGPGTGDLLAANNLADLSSASISRTSLGLGAAAVLNTGTSPGNVVAVQTGGKLPPLSAVDLTSVPPSTWTLGGHAGAYTILAADKGLALTFTGASNVTWGVTACATLGNGWWAPLHNAGTGIVTLDPNGSETADGRATIKIYPGERFFLRTDGVNLFTVGRAKRVLAQSLDVAGLTNADLETALADTEAVSVDFEFSGLVLPSNPLVVRFKQGGSYVTSGDYSYALIQGTSASNSAQGFATILNGTPAAASGKAALTDPFSTVANTPKLQGQMSANTADTTLFAAKLNLGAAIQGVRLFMSGSGGNFTSGTIRTYVVRE